MTRSSRAAPGPRGPQPPRLRGRAWSAGLVAVLLLTGCAADDVPPRDTIQLEAPDVASPTPSLDAPTPSPAETVPASPGAGAAADPEACDGTVGAVAVRRVRVPPNATCVLEGTRVAGDVQVDGGGQLRANDVTIEGNLRGKAAGAIALSSVRVEGNLEAQQGGTLSLEGSVVTGNVKVTAHRGAVTLAGSTIDGNVEVEDNGGSVTITGNAIAGDLECEDNDPPPTGDGNRVEGDREGECADL